METKFTKDGITIKSIRAFRRGCPDCYFGVECKNGNWNCRENEIIDWKIPDCVYEYDLDKNRIYIKIKTSLINKIR